MVDEEFTDDDFEEDMPPQPQTKVQVKQPSNPPATAVAKRAPQNPPVATKDVAAPTEKYTPYSLPSRIGVFDNELGRPILEDTEINGIILALLTRIANDVDELKGRL